MTTTGSEGSLPPRVGTPDWTASSDAARDRRAAGTRRDMKALVRDTAYQRLGAEKNRASDAMDGAAAAIRSLTQQLRDDGQAGLADYITKAADRLERWGAELRRQDLQDALRRLESFARQQPALFLGIAFGAGVLAARFLKSSPPDRVPPLAGGVL